ncbi:hypothetical protein OCU04_000764 [Sclerotinia nivalis]|uniref:Uncharacterized protein n=1 Tax=Sclerotinia nivalis TaxID=352851 RepID=A0A9X0AWS8_9HELO|nr:hypothetical protein OCU04_000764 [Sclerotinia nivalis]
MAFTRKPWDGEICLSSYSRFKLRAIANSTCRHMKELKQKALGRPRSIRRSKEAISRIEAVRAKRTPVWPGDRMLLAKLNNSTPDNIMNYCEEKARREAKNARKAGGQVLKDWEAEKKARKSSNKYAAKMWAEYKKPGNNDEYLRKLENGLISLETGETINGDSSQHRGSALNPANGYIQSIPDIVHAPKGIGKAGDEGTKGGAANNAYTMGHVMENEVDYQRYDTMAGSSQYLIHKWGLSRSEDEVEHDVNQRLSLTNSSLESFDSQMAYKFSKYPAFKDDRFGGSKPRPTLSEYESFDLQTMSQHGRPMPASMQPSSHETCTSTAAVFEEQDKRANHVGPRVQEDWYEYPDPSRTTSTAPWKKRKEGLLEEETVDVRQLKRQRQLEARLESEQQFVSEQRFQPQSQYNGLDVGEGGVDEELEPELEVGFDFSGVAIGEYKWHKYDWHEGDVQRNIAFDVEYHNHGSSDQGKKDGTSNGNAHAEGRLETGPVASTEHLRLVNTNRLPVDMPENAIVIPGGGEEDEAAMITRSIGNRASVVGEQATNEADVPGYFHETSSHEGHTNAWYCQGTARTSETAVDSPWQSGHHFDGHFANISN